MSGRRPAADPPSPDAWMRLYAQARRYLEQRPWERFDDAVRFPMTLDAGRSRRCGWPAGADRMPVLLAWDGEGRPGELDASMAATMTSRWPPCWTDATRMEPADAGGSELRGELELSGGRRARYRVAAVLPVAPPGGASLLVLGGEIQDDLLSRGGRVLITRYPWTEMPTLRLTADITGGAPRVE